MALGPMELEEDIAPDPQDFKHEPLPNAQTHIRLLKIVEARDGQLAKCTLSTWPLDTAPPYCAISYTWGDPGETVDIEVNTKRKIVRRNCEYVLQQAYASNWNSYFWIDAGCIDQENTDEKNFQVAIMGGLYKRATVVFACVGPEADDSNHLFEILERHSSFFERAYHSNFMEASPIGDRIEIYTLIWNTSRLWRSSMTWRGLFLRRKRFFHAFIRLLSRPNFSRAWV